MCMIQKKCTRCNEVKPVDQFSKDVHMSDKLSTRCKSCLKLARDKYRNDNKDRFRDLQKESLRRRRKEVYSQREAAAERVCKMCQKLKPSSEFGINKNASHGLNTYCLECFSIYQFQRQVKRYGITLDDYNDMFSGQSGKCAICGAESKLMIDHDHTTGEVRGLLCLRCNTGLGMFRDSPEFLSTAINYLK